MGYSPWHHKESDDLATKQQQRDRTGAVGPFLSCVPRSSRSEFTFSHLNHVDLLSRQAY